ncbi:glycosyltransferase family 2 protein [Candidatus Microgenomates bacterium]|nr:glycosyltransferase family 2 protein [Candidatus Microgenomates bacterium]
MHKIAVIIVNYYEEKLFGLINSLLKEKTEKVQIEVIVVDNGSDEKDQVKLNQLNQDQKIKLTENHQDLGYAAGCNLGIHQALKDGCDAVILINPDTKFDKGFLGKLSANKAEIVAPVFRFKRNNLWMNDFGGKVNWFGRTKHLECNPSTTLRAGNEMIDYVTGCCMMIRRKVFEKIGFFDERFFMYFEDVDFCLRAKKAGFRVTVDPKAILTHDIKEGIEKPLSQKLMHLKSNFLFINKWTPWFMRPVGYIYCLLLLIKILLSGLT